MRNCSVIFFLYLLMTATPGYARVILKPSGEISGQFIVAFKSLPADKNIGRGLRSDRHTFLRHLRDNQQRLIERLNTDLAHSDIKILRNLWVRHAVTISLSPRYLDHLKKLEYIESIRIDTRYRALPQSVVTLAQSGELVQDNLQRIDIDGLWAAGYRGQGTVIAILDSGVDLQHVDLINRWRGGINSWFDPYGEHSQPFDVSGHGTAVSSIIVGGNANGSYIGVAPAAQWIAARVFNDKGDSSESAISEALQWVIDPDGDPDTDDFPDIVQNSWGLGGTEGQCINPFRDELSAIDALGIDIVFAVGNSGLSGTGAGGSSSYLTPAFDPHVISVGALKPDDSLLFSSSRGPDLCGSAVIPSLVAPGQFVTTADLTFNGFDTNNTTVHDGTSFSSPHVSGALALLRSHYIAANHLAYRNALFDSAKDLGRVGDDSDYGRGLVQASLADARLQAQTIPVRSNEVNFTSARYEFAENSGTNVVKVIRSGDLTGAATVSVFSSDGSAINGEDYNAVLQVLNFASGESVKSIDVSLINDTVGENTETFDLSLSLNSNVNIGARSTITLAIRDDDEPPKQDMIGGASISLLQLLLLGLLMLGRRKLA